MFFSFPFIRLLPPLFYGIAKLPAACAEPLRDPLRDPGDPCDPIEKGRRANIDAPSHIISVKLERCIQQGDAVDLHVKIRCRTEILS